MLASDLFEQSMPPSDETGSFGVCCHGGVVAACRPAGSDSSMTALMTLAEIQEAEEAKSDNAAMLFTRASLDLRSVSIRPTRSGHSECGDMVDSTRVGHTGSAIHSLQLTAER